MEEFNLLEKLERVKAPPGFEQKIMAQLSLRRRQLRTRQLRLSLAGAFSGILVLFIVINVFVLPERGLVRFVGFDKDISTPLQERDRLRGREFIPIIEPVDYTREMRSISRQPSTIYILEQISDETSAELKF